MSRWPYILLVTISMLSRDSAMGNEQLLKMEKDPSQWVLPGGNYASWRYSELHQITAENVHNLQPVWTFSTGVLRGHEGSPLVLGDVMYVQTPFPNDVFALDLNADEKILWKYSPRQDPSVIAVMCCDTVNRGLAYGDGKIILEQADTTVVALDAKTGEEVWSVKNGDPGKGETMTGAPLAVKDRVIVGISGGEYGILGRVTAYGLADGKRLWTAYSQGSDAAPLTVSRTNQRHQHRAEAEFARLCFAGQSAQVAAGSNRSMSSSEVQLVAEHLNERSKA
jgi:lanthanide-dependent methanol dehydrogenase